LLNLSHLHQKGEKMATFTLRQTRQLLTSQSGLALVGALLHRTHLKRALNRLPSPKNRGFTVSNGDIAVSMIGLLTQAKTDFEAIEPFKRDRFFSLALRLKRVPSAATLRQRLDKATAAWDRVFHQTVLELLVHHAHLTPCYEDYIPLDMDVSPMDNSGTKKEGVSLTYKKVEGYAPLFIYIGQEGYWLNLDFRPGKSHSQCEGTVQFLTDTLESLPKFPHKMYLLRADSAHDSVENFIAIEGFNQKHPDVRVDFIIKHNLRREPKEQWLHLAKAQGKRHTPRPGKTVYTGRTQKRYPGLEHPLYLVYDVTVRTSTATGQQFLVPDVQVDVYVTTLDRAPEVIIRLYHDHATSEQYHSEIKSDMGLERLPSGYFATNQRVMFLAMIAFNLLRIMGQESLDYKGNPIKARHRIRRRRLRSVIQDLIYLAAHLISRSRGWILDFGQVCPFYETFSHLYLKWAG
jgi:hypothetical protein